MSLQEWLCYLVLFNVGFTSALLPLPHFESQCLTRCPLQNQTEDGHGDVTCGPECRINQCVRGCDLWQRALETSCQVVCNGTHELVPLQELYCVLGCNDAVSRYFHQLKELIGTLPPPALVADTLTSTSLSLEWDGPRFANISYLVQWRYEEIADTWQYCCNQSWGPYSTVHVDNLRPYTKYRFRITLLLSPHHREPIVSEPSLVISTLPGGAPSSPPHIVRITAADSTRVSVSWEPGTFPNGPILSFMLQINELPTGYTIVKEIPASENKDFYMFQNLVAARNYSVSVSMRNAAGQGPTATAFVFTPAHPQVKVTQQLNLILGAHHTVISQAVDLLDDPIIIYETSHLIRGVALHVRQEILFVSDSSDTVWMMSGHSFSTSKALLSNLSPHDLSVDWLNDHLYILTEATTRWQVVRCGLTPGTGTTVAVAGLHTKPHHMEVDPYNGYLFWVIQGPVGGGLYRLDLADISNGVKHEIIPDLIFGSPHLGAFTVDHTSFRILVPNQMKNTVVAVSLDGHEVNDIRNNTQQPHFQNVVSLTMASGLFYWTNGERVLTEEYHAGQNSYFHNFLSPHSTTPSFLSISVNLSSSQPIPIPVNPPTGVQAILGSQSAKTSWTAPHLLGGQGKGAWQNWSYQLSVKDVKNEVVNEWKDINSTFFTFTDLRPGTQYILKVAAYTNTGVGPWSSEFRGQTLRNTSEEHAPTILWSAAEGLLRSDVTGERVDTLIHRDNLKDRNGYHHIIDITWHQDMLYLVSNTSHVHWYNMTSHNRGRLRDLDSVGSIAVDWIGKKLYWSNPKQQLIIRGSLNGIQHEPLPILTVAKELNIDAVKGFIYWSTGHAVESARLNGKQKKTYYPAELFSGKLVMGLTIDTDRREVYWIVRSVEGASLFRAETADKLKYTEEVLPQKISSLQYSNMQGPLCYFDDHLVWLRDDRYAVIGDMLGQNSAVLSGMSLSGLNIVAIMDPGLHNFPRGRKLSDINVIPTSVLKSSIQIEGNFKEFRICWDPVQNVNYGQIFYEIKVRHKNKKDIVRETSEPYWLYENPADLAPYSSLTVSVRALTYWGASVSALGQMRSPPSIPSQPTNPRVFVNHKISPAHRLPVITAVFRWDQPVPANGVIIKYIVRCWLEGSTQQICASLNELPPTTLELIVSSLPQESTIGFKVSACTEVGCGETTQPQYGNLSVEKPVPRLLLSTSDSLVIVDSDTHKNLTLSRSGAVVDVAYSSHNDHVYWIDETNHLITSRTNASDKTTLLSLNNTGLCLTVDWVGQYLYWAERINTGRTSVLFVLDLNTEQHTQRVVLARTTPIVKIQVDPLSSMLYWVEESFHGIGTLMKCHTDGLNVQPFFPNSLIVSSRSTCNCPEDSNVGAAMTIDHSDPDHNLLFYIDAWTNCIMAADMDGCYCQIQVNRSDSGLPPTSLTVDHHQIYWSNSTEGTIYSLTKYPEQILPTFVSGMTSINATGVHDISVIGTHLQPYPDYQCLTPKQEPGQAQLVNSTDHAIMLLLPLPEREDNCGNVSLASVLYSIYYGTSSCLEDLKFCNKKQSFDRLVMVDGLQELSNYTFILAYTNYYGEAQGTHTVVGDPVFFRTFSSALSPPQNVSVLTISPTALRILWHPSTAMFTSYQLLWKKEGVVEWMHLQDGDLLSEQNVGDNNVIKWADLTGLSPGQEYTLGIRAKTEYHHQYSESVETTGSTYPEPCSITMVEATASSLNVSWTRYPKQSYVWAELESITHRHQQWTSVPLHCSTDDTDFFFLDNLIPTTQYSFRLRILFTNLSTPYEWPSDYRFTFQTLGDCPSKPGVPVLHQLRGNINQVVWDEPVRDNGGKIDQYLLEGRTDNRIQERTETNYSSSEEQLDEEAYWSLYYNGSKPYWIMMELNANTRYQFRVRVRNNYGWSEWSGPSEWFSINRTTAVPAPDLGMIVWVFIPLAVLALVLTLMCLMYTVVTKKEKKKKAQQMLRMRTAILRGGGTDVELANLRELPRGPNFIQTTNAMYSAADFIPTDREIALLPHIPRENITLIHFLGSGAFGEVFEGIAKNLPDFGGIEAKVAVKTLRKGASQQEKLEFLKEAQLMSNFKHENILQLVGVCLDNDPNFIIMELMEGGDLLAYLRSHRPLITVKSQLTLQDLLCMCVDVARGCCYLEELHFVHRDLACRNCLVSSTDPTMRVVKIGDFGLARDIYKNDYYRKEGEGLLPVRWMAPESLVDGVFTNQSDVWSFGVLLWEIMSLGQQPYPARNNLEVLHYVRNGGRLSCPKNCDQQMYDLMLQCWSFNSEDRPSFTYCLDILMELQKETCNSQIHSVHEETRLKEGWRSDGHIAEELPHKYLELIYDEEGYEVPRPPPGQAQQEAEVSSLDKLLPVSYTNVISQLSVTDSTINNESVHS